jgi:hypothetical protein
MSVPTPFEIKCAEEASGSPWPDLSQITSKVPAVVEPRPCVRCRRPVTGDKCPTCRAYQATYTGAL